MRGATLGAWLLITFVVFELAVTYVGLRLLGVL